MLNTTDCPIVQTKPAHILGAKVTSSSPDIKAVDDESWYLANCLEFLFFSPAICKHQAYEHALDYHQSSYSWSHTVWGRSLKVGVLTHTHTHTHTHRKGRAVLESTFPHCDTTTLMSKHTLTRVAPGMLLCTEMKQVCGQGKISEPAFGWVVIRVIMDSISVPHNVYLLCMDTFDLANTTLLSTVA